MKKIYCLLLLIIFILSQDFVFAQENLIYKTIQETKAKGIEVQVASSAFSQVSGEKMMFKHFGNPEKVEVLHFEDTVLTHLENFILLDIPLKTGKLQLELLEVQSSFYNYQIETSDGSRFFPNQNIKHYRGVVKDNPNSLVAISFLENEVVGLVVTDEGNFNLVLDKKSGRHIFYNDKNLNEQMDFQCATHEQGGVNYDPEILAKQSKMAIQSEGICVGLYFETEQDVFQTRGSFASVEFFVTGIYNQVATLYQNENIETSLAEIFVWTTPDPYESNDTQVLLEQFQDNRTTFNGDLGQLLTFRSIGGGLAAGFNGLCNPDVSERLSVSQLFNTYEFVPNYSWTVQVIAHEFGHLFGSRHTHACVWNGDDTAIDGCGSCMENPDPEIFDCFSCDRPGTPSGGGTIMSYCHLQGNPGINFNLGFGLQPGNVMRNSVANANCLCECVYSTISGPDFLCSSAFSEFFTVNNVPLGASISWDSTPSGALSFSDNSDSPTVTWLGGNFGEVTITAMITTACETVEVSKSISVGGIPQNELTIIGDHLVCHGNYLYTVEYFGDIPISGYQWYFPPGYSATVTNPISAPNQWMISIPPYEIFPQTIELFVQTPCGNQGPWLIELEEQSPGCSSPFLFSVYPNPADDEFMVVGKMEFQSVKSNTIVVPNFSAILFDQDGNPKLENNSVDGQILFKTNHLRQGVYVLQILNNGDKEERKILVQH
ncbi:zinc-dependent metalloprotease [Anditalea andensis]|uniref:Peptidase M12B domain-containing protein n=1 Tax=Anditalea andensis TaxID=1048983 RepID=A0A074L2N2_9BACT|nr:zinc-dependent metalloprotease [Anditalea andensis]KEO75449.1 hypothetical protein EL17_00910 [Anditalea andensis]